MPANDTMISQDGTSVTATYQNNGSSIYLGASMYTGVQRGEYSMLRFNLSSLPVGAVVSSVSLKITASFSYSYSFGETLRVWQMDADNSGWVEGTGSGSTSSGGATGRYLNQTSYTSNAVNSGTNWASGGVFNRAGGDLGAEVGALSLGTSVTAGSLYSVTLSPALIDSWLTDSSLLNAGLVFHLTNNESSPAGSRFSYFNSSNATTGKPYLEIIYTTVPEPSVIGLLFAGVLVVFVIRRLPRKSGEICQG